MNNKAGAICNELTSHEHMINAGLPYDLIPIRSLIRNNLGWCVANIHIALENVAEDLSVLAYVIIAGVKVS